MQGERGHGTGSAEACARIQATELQEPLLDRPPLTGQLLLPGHHVCKVSFSNTCGLACIYASPHLHIGEPRGIALAELLMPCMVGLRPLVALLLLFCSSFCMPLCRERAHVASDICCLRSL